MSRDFLGGCESLIGFNLSARLAYNVTSWHLPFWERDSLILCACLRGRKMATGSGDGDNEN